MDSGTPRVSGIPRASKLPIFNAKRKPSGSAFQYPSRPSKAQSAIPPSSQTPLQADGTMKEDSNRSLPQSSQDFTVDQSSTEKAFSHNRTRKPRPSLSDRTMETLSRIPPTPSPARRRSSFFTAQSPMTSPTRPHTSLSSRRPSISRDSVPPLPPSFSSSRPASPMKRSIAPPVRNTSAATPPEPRRDILSESRTLSTAKSKLDRSIGSRSSMSKSADSDRQIQEQNQHTRGRIAPKLPATRTPMPRSQVRQRVAVEATDRSVRGSPKPAFSSSRDSKHPTKRPGTLSDEKPKGKIETSTKFSSITDSPKSSAALRQTIAKAKAAHRTGSTFPNAPGAAFGNDSFPEVILSGNNSASLNKRIRSARMDGKLNIAAMGLKQLPAEILSMYDMNDDIADGSWAESVDLVKLIAADNEITYIEDSLLPVGKPETFANGEEDSQGLVLASLENLDMHGNLLRTLPHRMENLQCLTILNLSRNRIDNEDLKTIGRIRTLRELHVAENMVKGCVNHELYGLSRLESLDLSYNAITQISRGIARLSNLHTLKMAGNKITSLPADLVEVTALKDLDVSQNSLRGSLLPVSVKRSISLKIIDASFNALDSITGCENLKIPALQILKISQNRLTSLADVSCSPELTTLVADGNKLASIPEGFASLTKLRNADLSRNDIRHVDDHIGLMENLVVCSLANNPLRERRLLNMNTEDLKRELRSRHCQSSASNKENAGSGQNNDEKEGEQGELPSNIWSIQAGGVVDRSRSNIADIEATDLQGLAESGSVKTCLLHHNMLPIVPLVLDLLADTLVSLDISHNKLQGDKYLLEVLCLPKLRVLDLSANAIGSLEPLLSALTAPSLSELNVSRNRLVKLPELRSHFPLLTSIFAADNSISDLSFESVRGLQSLDVKSNEISFLEPKIGVLAYEGLRMFLVDANIFRVPRRDIVEKGSEAILTWLRSRIEDDA